MNRTIAWIAYAAYALIGAAALMLATSAGVAALGLSMESLSFLPARIAGLPWSIVTFFVDDGPVTALALLGISYALNLSVGLMLAIQSGENVRRPAPRKEPGA